MVGVASTHKALDPSRKIVSVDFNLGRQGNRNELNVTGKRKRVRSAPARSKLPLPHGKQQCTPHVLQALLVQALSWTAFARSGRGEPQAGARPVPCEMQRRHGVHTQVRAHQKYVFAGSCELTRADWRSGLASRDN